MRVSDEGPTPKCGASYRRLRGIGDRHKGDACHVAADGRLAGVKVFRVAMLMAVLAVPLACGQLGSPESVDAEVIEPLPRSLELVSAGTFPCRGSGEIGWEYTYVVVLGDNGEVGGPLYSHLEKSGFALRPSGRSDWVVTDGISEEALIRLGPVSRWRTHDVHILEGPTTSEVEQAIGEWDGPAELVGLEPVGVTCEI